LRFGGAAELGVGVRGGREHGLGHATAR
jgi:hypothetical protein